MESVLEGAGWMYAITRGFKEQSEGCGAWGGGLGAERLEELCHGGSFSSHLLRSGHCVRSCSLGEESHLRGSRPVLVRTQKWGDCVCGFWEERRGSSPALTGPCTGAPNNKPVGPGQPWPIRSLVAHWGYDPPLLPPTAFCPPASTPAQAGEVVLQSH